MLAEERYKQLLDLVNFSTKEELIWINGYLSGLVSNGFSKPGTEPSFTTVQPSIVHHHSRITVLYGTETGNSKKVATQLTTALRKKNLPVKLQATEQYRLSDLAQEETLIIVISTQGEGEPPATAKKFYDHVHQATLKLGNVKYAVLGLGDTSYPLYCQAALDIDKKIQEAGATALLPLAKLVLIFIGTKPLLSNNMQPFVNK